MQGDNLVALKALLPRYAGQVKCIYIDPPYNTGNEGWVYNDNVKAPEMVKWLGQVVGKEAEDLSRHDKWLCMMYPRLQLLKRFLREDGAIFVSIDDNEVAALRLLMDEVFGARNFIANVIWHKKYARQNDSLTFSTSHDYVIVYAKAAGAWRPGLLERTADQVKGYKNPDNDPRGPWQSVVYTCGKSRAERPNLFYRIQNPFTGRDVWPAETRVWGCDPEATQQNIAEGRLWWGPNGDLEKPRKKVFLSELGEGVVPDTLWARGDAGDTQDARREILEIFGTGAFQTPKPTRLLQRILQIATDKDSLVLDSFAGSGTTAHAVLKQNAEDGGTRRFILVEMEEKIARTITAERVRRVIVARHSDVGKVAAVSKAPEHDLFAGDTKASPEAPTSECRATFRFAVLGDTLFDAEGNIRETVRFEELAEFVWFQQTGVPMVRTTTQGGAISNRPPENDGDCKSPLLGVHRGRGVYLLFNGILGDKTVNGGNVLTRPVLHSLPPHEGPKVIYAAACRISELHLRRLEVEFKQLPYQLEVNAWL